MGSYVNKNLGANETVIAETRYHLLIMFLRPGILVLVAIALFIFGGEDLGFIAIIPVVLAVIAFLSSFIKYISTEIALTSNRVIVKAGFISRSASDISLKKVEGIDVKQSILGRIFNYGSMKVRGTGSGDVWYSGISNPYGFQKAVNEKLSETP